MFAECFLARDYYQGKYSYTERLMIILDGYVFEIPNSYSWLLDLTIKMVKCTMYLQIIDN